MVELSPIEPADLAPIAPRVEVSAGAPIVACDRGAGMRRPARQYRFVRRPFGPGETVVELKMVLSTPDETVSHIVDVDLSAFEGLAFGIGAREIIRSRIEVMLREACDHDIIELDA